MNFNKIEYPKPSPAFGDIYHGDHLDQQAYSLPGPLFIVTVDTDEQGKADAWIDHKSIFGNLSFVIDDGPNGVYPDTVLLAIAHSIIGILSAGVNVYIHCWSGFSRSTYVEVATLMRMLDLSRDDALALIVTSWPAANPIEAFRAHLAHMEPMLRH